MKNDHPTSGADRRSRPRGHPLDGLRNLLFRWLRWAAARFRSAFTVLGLFLSVGLLATVLAMSGFVWLSRRVATGYTQQFDVMLMRQVERFHTPLMDVAALEVTALGSIFVVALVAAVASTLLWTSEHRWSVVLLWVAIVGGAVLNLVLKAGFDRPRPDVFDWRVEYAGQSSFPSGHAMLSMVVYWTLAYLVSRLERPPLLRWLTWAFALLLVLLIGASRVYLGVHYPSDVIAGFVVGFVWATICATGMEVIRFFRNRDPRMRQGEKDLDRGTPLAPGATTS
jgi:membrane-associated phospholipid phosphatase